MAITAIRKLFPWGQRQLQIMYWSRAPRGGIRVPCISPWAMIVANKKNSHFHFIQLSMLTAFIVARPSSYLTTIISPATSVCLWPNEDQSLHQTVVFISVQAISKGEFSRCEAIAL